MWHESHRFDEHSRLIADRHYNRQKPGTPQFVPPGRCLVLRSTDELSIWVTSWPFAEFTKHAWAGAWVNSCFRREGGEHQASTMIRAAVAATVAKWPDVPELGMVTFVDASKVRHKRDPGRCYVKAGFTQVGETKGGLLAFQLLPADMPDAAPAHPPHGTLFSPRSDLVTAWREAVTRFLTDDEMQAELVAHATGHTILCAATQLHDRGPDGTCRDCLLLLTPDAAVCDDKRTIDLPRTPFGGIR